MCSAIVFSFVTTVTDLAVKLKINFVVSCDFLVRGATQKFGDFVHNANN